MGDTHETLNYILAEMRGYDQTPPPRCAWLDLADRIEAAASRMEAHALNVGAFLEQGRMRNLVKAPTSATATLPDLFMLRAVKRFAHACDKHPYFADTLVSDYSECSDSGWLYNQRDSIKFKAKRKYLATVDVELCEHLEMRAELHKLANAKQGTAAYEKARLRAIDEAYDAIAVLMRIICVLEGKQTLGQPKKGTMK